MFLTAAHCVSDTTSEYNIVIENKNKDNKTVSVTLYPLDVLRNNSFTDVAVLGVRDTSAIFTTVDVAKDTEVTEKWGTPVWAVGYPLMEELTITSGLMTDITNDPIRSTNDDHFYRTTIPIAGGSSGGGLYELVNGTYKLVGTAYAGNTQVSFISMYSLAVNVNKELEAAEQDIAKKGH